jgi:hypothetical protein
MLLPEFNNIIGVRNNANLTSTKGLYVNSLPVLSWQFITDIMPSDYANAEEFFTSVYGVAVNDILSKTQSYMSAHFVLADGIDSIPSNSSSYRVGTYLPAFNGWRGVRMSMNRCHTGYKEEYGSIYISSFSFCCNNTASVNFRIRDEFGNKWTGTVAMIAGEPQDIQVMQRFDSNIIYLESDNTGISVLSTRTGRCPSGCHVNSVLNTMGLDGFNGTQTGTEAYGIIVGAQLVCSLQKISTAFIESHEWCQALLYQTAYNLLQHSIVPTTRTNPSSIRQLEERKEMLDEWEKQVNKNMKSFRDNASKLVQQMSRKSSCIICSGGYYVG